MEQTAPLWKQLVMQMYEETTGEKVWWKRDFMSQNVHVWIAEFEKFQERVLNEAMEAHFGKFAAERGTNLAADESLRLAEES